MKEFLVTFEIDNVSGDSGYITVENGKVNSDSVEEIFYSLLRKSEQKLLEITDSEERDRIIEHLTPTDEDKLKEVHSKDYTGTDDDMPDDYENWLSNLSLDELKENIK